MSNDCYECGEHVIDCFCDVDLIRDLVQRHDADIDKIYDSLTAIVNRIDYLEGRYENNYPR